MVASRTPWDSSFTVSRSGQRVIAMRRRRSASASSGMLTRKGRIASPSLAPIGESPWFDGWLGGVSPAAAAAARFRGSRLTAPAAADVASRSRRVGDVDSVGTIVLPGSNCREKQFFGRGVARRLHPDADAGPALTVRRKPARVSPSLRLFGRRLDQLGDDCGLRHVDGVAALHLDRGAARALGHEAFQVGIDFAILRRDRIPTWFVAPRRVGDGGAEGALIGTCEIAMKFALFAGRSAAKSAWNAFGSTIT